MKTKLFKFFGVACLSFATVMVSCGNKTTNDETTGEEKEDTEEVKEKEEAANDETAQLPQMSEEEMKDYVVNVILPIIPDHGIDNKENLKKYATPSLSSVLIEAFDMPEMYPGEIGDEEFLYYFVSGNDMEEGAGKAKVNSLFVDGSDATANVTWAGSKHLLYLVRDSKTGIWQLDDFDNQKKEVENYVKTGRKYYESGEYKNAEYSTPEWEGRVKKYISTYLNK